MREGMRKKRNPKRQPEAEFEMRRGGHSGPEVGRKKLILINERP